MDNSGDTDDLPKDTRFLEILPGFGVFENGDQIPRKKRRTKKNMLKVNVKSQLPVLLKYIPEEDPDWDRFDKLFSQKEKSRIQEAKGETMFIEACLYDIILAARKRNMDAIILLGFFEVMLEELLEYINDEEKDMIQKNIKNMLVNLDFRYLNFIGELAVLNGMMKSGLYRIEQVECKLPDSASRIDFKLRKISDGSIWWVEVLNIHPDGDRIELDKGKVARFFTDRYLQKIASKKTETPIYLIPVIWAGRDVLVLLSAYFSQYPLSVDMVHEPFVYASFRAGNKKSQISYLFTTISELYKYTRISKFDIKFD